ncbi:MFS transporter [Nonomuraea jabiensis]|uniref:MFS family permease n=1 Tax=Nonomuraea jabiensis TaxID=882448 RepID=A0A7W9LEK4_9ACTN|nr:MFS transporter [Nonomuraea jabiensis]MBB5780793.1 MFS family permease [Nonomuraea jabiensis]
METREYAWTRGNVFALVALCSAQVLDAVDTTVVNVALPAIEDELGFAAADLSWVVNAYMVPFGGFLLLGGRLGDLFGHRRILMGGVALFTGASLVAGLAQNAGVLIGARAAQGLAAALVAPMTPALIALIFPEGRARSRAFAVWATATAVSSTLGLVVSRLGRRGQQCQEGVGHDAWRQALVGCQAAGADDIPPVRLPPPLSFAALRSQRTAADGDAVW